MRSGVSPPGSAPGSAGVLRRKPDTGWTAAPAGGEGGVHRDAVQPGGHRGLAPEGAQGPPGVDEGVLGRLLDVAGVVEQARHDRAHPAFVTCDQDGEAVEVPGPGVAPARRRRIRHSRPANVVDAHQPPIDLRSSR